MPGTVHRQDARHGTTTASEADPGLLRAVTELQARFIAEHDSTQAFLQTVACLLELTESEYGFIFELERNADGSFRLRTLAATDFSRSGTRLEIFPSHVESGFEFHDLENLFGKAIRTGQVVISNDPENESQSSGATENHPPLKSFLGVPLRFNGELVGMLGLANRQAGYDEDLATWLEPLTAACAVMVVAVRSDGRRKQAEAARNECEEHFRQIADLTTEVTFVAEVGASGDFRIRSLYGNLEQILGVTDHDALSSSWMNHVHPEDVSLIRALIASTQIQHIAQEVVRWRRTDGTVRRLQVTARRTSSSCSDSVATADRFRIDGCVTDVTAALQSEKTMREIIQRHQAILQAVPDLMFLTTREGQFLDFWSSDQANLLVSPDDFVGHYHRSFLPSDVCDRWDETVRKVLSDGTTHSFDYSLSLDAGTRWFEARVVACCDVNDSILTLSRDITEWRDAEEAEARQFALLKEIARNTQELIFVKDAQQRMLFLNEATAKVMGAPVEEILGRSTYEGFPGAAPDIIDGGDQFVLNSGRSHTSEQTVSTPEGERNFLTSKSPWYSRSGELVGLIGIAQDITELTQTNWKLEQSRQFVERIAEASPHIMYVFDIVEQRNLYSNRQIAEDLGYSPDEVQKMGTEFFSRTLHPDDVTRVPELLARWETARDGDVLEQEYRMKTADGHWRWFLGRDTVFQRDEDGRVRQIIGTAQDITDRIETQQALQESESRLRAIIESEPECVKLVARDGTLLEINSAGLGFVGAKSPDDVVGRCVFDLIAPEYQQQFRDFHEAVCDGRPGVLEMEIVGLKGERRRMETHAVPLAYGADGQTGHLAVTRDVTDIRKAEELVAQQHAQLLHVSRLSSLGQMAGTISHEITQPLSAISNYAATCRLLLQRPESSLETFSRHIDSIAQQALRAGDTLDRIRSFIRGGDTPKQSCQIADVISSSLDLMRASLRNRHAQVVVRASDDLPQVMVDCVQIQQVITNLVTNSCDAMQDLPTCGRSIEISCLRDGGFVVVKVEDAGPGLDNDLRDRLFDAFFTSKSEGMGLGLAICRDIVTAHGGSIGASNSPTGGAVFQFTLPCRQEDTDD